MIEVPEYYALLRSSAELIRTYEAKVRSLETLAGGDRSSALRDCQAMFIRLQDLQDSICVFGDKSNASSRAS